VKNFKINSNLSTKNKNRFLKDKIKIFLKDKSLKYLMNFLSKNFNMKLKDIEFYIQKKFFFSYNLNQNKFENKINIFYAPKYLVLYLIFYFFFLFKKKTEYKKQKYLLLIDEVYEQTNLNYYKKLINCYKKNQVCFRSNVENLKIKNASQIKWSLFNCNKPKNFISIGFKLLFISFFLTFKYKINFFYIILIFLKDYVFFDSLYSKYQFKNIIRYIHYFSNNIERAILQKKYPDSKINLIQKNIDNYAQIGWFYDCDNFFCFSKKSQVVRKNGNIGKIIPVGSFIMDSRFYINKSKKKYDKLDIIYFGGNNLHPVSYYDNHKDYAKCYENHLDWLKKLSLEFPNLKIGFKHHGTKDQFYEKKYLNDSKIIFVDDKINSYDLINASKIVLSFCSTMVIEARSLNKPAFFLNPEKKNNQFMDCLKHSNKIFISDYKSLKSIKKKFVDKKNNIKPFEFCLYSKDVSLKIYNIINN